ncbi:SDR family NAD(P)-dependent oxidoreductase [Streptomyces sp. NPDC001928]|uniref:SDR family NAD(P)-dependent oxidoreductase n=1 Tax=Streptomyces sp. NPDC001928 TaxID=3154404 RepID=UPI00332439D8
MTTTITTPYGFSSTATDVAQGIDLAGRRAIVTGASSGLGTETARVLAGTGAAVTLAVRDVAAGERVAKEIAEATGNRDLRVARLDLADPASIAAFTDAWHGPLHILVNNAGVMACPEQYTEQGWEQHIATNHLGHFALTTGLHAALAADGAARVVAVSSSGHQLSPIVWDDIHFAFRPYDPWLAYGQSKTANVLFAVEATRRWADDNITANAVMPGAVYTNLQRHTDGGRGSGSVPAELIKTVAQGAATAVLAATSPLLEGIGGRYFADCNEAEVLDRRGAPLLGVARYAVDPAGARRLWTLSERMLAAGPGH